MRAMPTYWIGPIVSPKNHHDPPTTPMNVSAVTGNAVLNFARRRTSIQKPKVISRHASADHTRQDCATIATQASVGVAFARRTAADLNSSCAALSETTRPAHSRASERRELELDGVIIR